MNLRTVSSKLKQVLLSCLPDFKKDKPISVVYTNASVEYCYIRASEMIGEAMATPSVAQERLTRAIQLLAFAKEKLSNENVSDPPNPV